MKSFAIAIVCYNRIHGVKRLLSSLEKVDYEGRNDINLIFSIDYSGSSEIEEYAQNYEWKHGTKRIRTFKENLGLKKHIISCGDLTDEYDIVAVLEDDLFVSNSFYSYAYSAADYYYEDDRIGGISLYSFQKNWLDWIYRFEPQKTEYDTYFLKVAQSWGQVWTKHQWQSFKEWYLNNTVFVKSDDIPSYLHTWPESSWLKYYDVYLIRTNRYFVYPYYSLSTNFSDAGVHSKIKNNDHQVELIENKKKWLYDNFDFSRSIIYDEYMDRVSLGTYLGIDDSELTNDINGTKNSKYYRRYVISMAALNYKVIRSFELCLRPIEQSIEHNIVGDDIFLYDTTIIEKPKKGNERFKRYVFSSRSSHFSESLLFSLKGLFGTLDRKLRSLPKKLRRRIKRK